jgi:hypothetical protein
MYRNDYIMKMIEEFSKVLGVIIGLKKNKEYEEAEQQVNEAMKKFTQADLDFILALNEADLIPELAGKMKLKEDQLQVIAELLFQTAEIRKGKDPIADVEIYYARSLSLYQWLSDNQHDVFSMEILQRIDLLRSLLKP